jgi:hypothetical protein
MKTRKINLFLKRNVIVLSTFVYVTLFITASGQNKILIYDAFHGQNPNNGKVFNGLLPADKSTLIEIDTIKIDDSLLKGKSGLILFSPVRAFQQSEKEAIINYLHSGGSLLLIFDEERRMSLLVVGVNDFIKPFGIELTADVPARHNCGAIADSSEVCSGKRELPYSGGRSIVGGTIISRVNDEGNYIHSAYLKLPAGGKIIVMSDGMAGLLLGRPDGERFHGTGPGDSKYWGKDSHIFMQEILAFLIKN